MHPSSDGDEAQYQKYPGSVHPWEPDRWVGTHPLMVGMSSSGKEPSQFEALHGTL